MQNSLIQIREIDRCDNTRGVLEQYLIPTRRLQSKLQSAVFPKYDTIPSKGMGRVMDEKGRGYSMKYSGGDANMTIYQEYQGGETEQFEHEVLVKIGIGTGLFEPTKTIWLKRK